MADSPTRPTPAPWRVHEHEHAHGELWLSIGNLTHEGTNNTDGRWIGPVAELKYLVAHDDEQRANAALIVAACNACQSVNPDNPQAVAHAIDTVIHLADTILKGFGTGAFVRDTSGDHNADWAIKLMPYITALARLKVALNHILPSRAALASIETQETP